MINPILTLATILSPIVGVVAIIVALIIARRSSNDTKRQIDAVYNLLDVFVASQNPTMLEATRKYEQQIEQLNQQIQKLEEDIQYFSPYFGRGPRVYDCDELSKKEKQCEQLEYLENKRNEIQGYLDLINAYLKKAKNQDGI